MAKGRDDIEEQLEKLFGSKARVRILSFFLENEGKEFYQREIVFEAGLSLQATQHELKNLEEIGIISRQESHSKVYYRFNPQSKFAAGLCAILKK